MYNFLFKFSLYAPQYFYNNFGAVFEIIIKTGSRAERERERVARRRVPRNSFVFSVWHGSLSAPRSGPAHAPQRIPVQRHPHAIECRGAVIFTRTHASPTRGTNESRPWTHSRKVVTSRNRDLTKIAGDRLKTQHTRETLRIVSRPASVWRKMC